MVKPPQEKENGIIITLRLNNMTPKSKALAFFKKDETKGIHEYKQAITKSSGKEKSTYKKILPQEEHHLRELKQVK